MLKHCCNDNILEGENKSKGLPRGYKRYWGASDMTSDNGKGKALHPCLAVHKGQINIEPFVCEIPCKSQYKKY